MRHLLGLVTFFMLIALQANAAAPSLDDVITSELDAAGLPGVAYAIIGDGILTAGAQGVTDLRTGNAVTPDTPFQIGSISKSFTAIAILQLVEAGDIELDASLAYYLDKFDQGPAGVITIRQLLGHTSGYSTLQGNSAHVERSENEDELSHQTERIAQWHPAYPPGSKWDYSNANYILLGAVIEAVSGSKYDDYIESNILEPVGMAHSFVGDGGMYEAIAVGHTPWFGGKRPIKDMQTSRAGAPAGGVVASANDLALYLEMLLNGRSDIISAENKVLMMQPASDQSPYYGLGWALNPDQGRVYHSGTSPGTDTIAILVPAERKGVVVLVNAGSGFGFGETANLINGISAQALDLDFARDQSAWGRQSLFLIYVLLPFLFIVGLLQAWRLRAGLRTKSGAFGAFSLWFPFVMTAVLAWVSAFLIPNLFGVSLHTLSVFSPDFSLALLATAITGLIWSLFRLGVYYSAKLSG